MNDPTTETRVKDCITTLVGGKKPVSGSNKAELDKHRSEIPEGKKVKFTTHFTVSGN